MNANRLLAHYERIADAPDAIARLRRFILDLAVRGKLVEQDPNDEPASELLKRIAKDKAHLVKARKISKQVSFQPRDLSEAPFGLPGSWDWCPSTYPSYIVSDRGKKIQTKDVVETGNFPVVDQGKMLIRGYHNDASKVIRVKEPIVLFGDHTRETKLIDFDFVVGADGVKLLHPVSLHTAYYFLALQWLPLESRGYGRHFKLLKASFIPLPPLAEQHRIVAKVDELMALCDRLEARRAEREATRDRVAMASLVRLNDPDPDPLVFRKHAAFAIENLTPLTTRRDQIKALRQTILNLAIRGKLVEQAPNDEPAAKLLRRLRANTDGKARRKARNSEDINADEVPFECPEGWMWMKIQQTLNPDREISYGVIKLGDEPRFGGIPTLRCSDVRAGFIDLLGVRKVDEAIESEYARTRLLGGEVVINIRGTLGGVALVPHALKGFNVAREVAVVPIANEISGAFVVYLMLSPYFWDHIQNNLRGIAYKGLNLGILRELPIPFPPLAEQHRIVAKVDELMALCGRLDVILATADDTRLRLLDALLHEVLMMAADRKSAA